MLMMMMMSCQLPTETAQNCWFHTIDLQDINWGVGATLHNHVKIKHIK